jgi:Fe2+ transport system protein FeoA
MIRLDRLHDGEWAQIVSVGPSDLNRVVRLSSLGLVPGVVVQLRRRSPVSIVAIGEIILALDGAVAGEIFVERLDLDGHVSCTPDPA